MTSLLQGKQTAADFTSSYSISALSASWAPTGTTVTFPDNQFQIFSNTDNTKIITFDASNIVGTVDLEAPPTGGIVATREWASGSMTSLDVQGVILASGSFGSGWTEPNLGNGVRMFWYPRKSAFRAGRLINQGAYWNNTSIGVSSIAVGEDVKAFGYAATAFGALSVASGDYSFAAGQSTNAGGGRSTALNVFTSASGYGTTALGFFTKAQSYLSVALGRWNVGGGTTDSWVATDPIFEIGIGVGQGSEANALTVLKNGDVNIPSGSLTVSNGIFTSIKTVTTTYTASITDTRVLLDYASPANVQLFNATGSQGKEYTFKLINSGSAAVYSRDGQTIDGRVSASLGNQWDVVRLIASGSNWYLY